MAWPLVLAAIGAGLSAYSSYKGGKEKSEGLEASAESELLSAAFNVRRQEGASSALIGRARALRGASGVAFTGSPLMVDEATVREAATNIEETKRLGLARAEALKKGAGRVRKAGAIGAATSLLRGAADFGFN